MELNINKEFVDAIAEKFGMFIDWTSDNVVPQIIDILMRYRTYELFSKGFVLAIWLFLFITGLIILIKMIKGFDDISYEDFPDGKARYQYIDKGYFSWKTDYQGDIYLEDITVIGFVRLIYGAVATIFGGVGFTCVIGTFIKWIFIPEIMFYQLIVG
ncbi:MAG: hypothetical protein E7167_01315 [Firmicutes bacterium]|nr:hypothetical protein [Bacillota bacterium]